MSELPNNWTQIHLNQICEIRGGNAFKSKEYKVAGIPLLRISNIDKENVSFGNKTVYLDSINLQYYPDFILKRNDIVIALSGATTGKYGKYRSDELSLLNQRVGRLRVLDQRYTNQDYIYHYLAIIRRDILKNAYGAAQPNISTRELGDFEIPLSPFPEQNRIVARIEELFTKLDAGVESLQKAKALLKQYRQSVLKAAMEGRLTEKWRRENGERVEPASALLERIQTERKQRLGNKYKPPKPVDTSNLPKLSDGWVWTRLDQVIWSSQYGTSIKCGYSSEGIPVLRIPNILNGKINLDDLKYSLDTSKLKNAEFLQPNDFLIIRTNGSRDLIGRGAIINDKFTSPHYFASYLIRFRIIPMLFLPQWISEYWKCSFVRNLIEKKAATTAGQYNISQSKLLDFPIVLPPITEQQVILTEISRQNSVIDQSELIIDSELNRSQSLRQSILKRAFEGKLVPQDPNDEPASVLLERIKHINKLNAG